MRPYSPHDLLPTNNPSEEEYKDNPRFFYDNVVQHLIPDVQRIMGNGIPIDLNRVSDLEDTVIAVLDSVQKRLASNGLVQEFLSLKDNYLKAKKEEEILSKTRTKEYYYKECKIDNMEHRTYIVNEYLRHVNKYDEFHLDKWTVNDLKKLNHVLGYKFFIDLLDKSLSTDHPIVVKAMDRLAQDKADVFNKGREDMVTELEDKILVKEFNPASAPQKQEFFYWLGIESQDKTSTDNDSFNRKELERLEKLIYLTINTMKEEKNA